VTDDSRLLLEEIFDALDRHQVRYIVIGGQAGAAWGSPLLTRDFDAVHARDRVNLEHLAAALDDLEATLRVPKVEEDLPFQLDATTLERGFNFTFRTRAGDVDFLGLPAGVDGFDELDANAVTMRVHGHDVRVASLEDLIRMKIAGGRPKDREAVETLVALRDERDRRGLIDP
jgi:hypothetical protein